MISAKGFSCGPHITRYYMYQQIELIMKSVPTPESPKVLSVSHSLELCERLNLKQPKITEANYPEFNLLKLDFPDNQFDFIISDEVMAHIEGDPQAAVNESYRVLKPDGIAIHTSCLIHPIHDKPGDFWRFTPDGLRLLCRPFSKIINVGGWGNFYVWFLDSMGLRFLPIPNAKWHPLHKMAMRQNPKWPVVTWVIAQK